MPSRMIREGLIDSRAVNALSDDGQILYYKLLLIVDDFGRHEAELELLRSRLFWRALDRWPLTRVRAALTDVSSMRTDDGHMLVMLYEANSKMYLQINNFNQRLRAKHPKCPAPDGHTPVIWRSNDGHVTAEEKRSEEKRSEEKGIIPIPKTDDTLADFTDELYAMGQPAKRKNKVLAEQEIVKAVSRGDIGPDGVDFATVKSRWKTANESNDWMWLDGAKAQTLAEWVGDGNYKYPAKGFSAKGSQPHPAFIRSAL